MFSGEGPLSPFSNVPWTSLVTFFFWALQAFSGRSGSLPATTGEIAWAWTLAALAYSFYIYKIVENIYITFNPRGWWVYRFLPEARRRNILRTASVTDGIDLIYVSAWSANGLLFYALFETLPDTLPNLETSGTAVLRLVRISSTIGFAGFGTGFTALVPNGAIAEFLAWLLTAIQGFTAAVVASNLIGIAASRRSEERKQRRGAATPS